LRVIQENFEERLCKKKKRMEGECLSILRRAKEVSIKESQHQKIKFHVFWCVYDKTFSVFKRLDWLYIKEKVGFAL
jgi:hypothetical protein